MSIHNLAPTALGAQANLNVTRSSSPAIKEISASWISPKELAPYNQL